MEKVYRVKVYKKGIIVIPREVRRVLNIEGGNEVELVVEGNEVKLRRPDITFEDLFGVDRGIVWEKELEELRREELKGEERGIG